MNVLMNNCRLNLLLTWCTFFLSGYVFSQHQLIGKFVIYERSDEPVKLAIITFYDSNDSIFYNTTTDNFGVINLNIDTNKIKRIKASHPLFGTSIVYEKGYDKLAFRDTFLIQMAFDYSITRRGEAIYYDDINLFLSEKNSKRLDLKGQNLSVIPKLNCLKKHGVEGLFLENNNISVIPRKLLKIKGLVYLDLSENKLDGKSIKLIDKWKEKGVMIIY
jgi:hypothetical protein